MAKKTKKVGQTALEIAWELAKVREEKATLEALNKTLTQSLLEALKSEQIDHAGDYKLTKATTLKVVEPEMAIQWAATVNCLKVDVTKAREILRHDFTDPSKYGFEVVTQEKITPLKGKDEEN